jgi:FAD synthase
VEKILDVLPVCNIRWIHKSLFNWMIANFPDESLPPMSSVTKTGVYYGYARIYCPEHETPLCDEDSKVLPMVMSLGWNPFYKNERMTAVRPISDLFSPILR